MMENKNQNVERKKIPEKGMSFLDAVIECACEAEFVSNYNRLTGNNFHVKLPRNPIEAMVDKACGFNGIDKNEFLLFSAFVFEYVWSRLPNECFVDEVKDI